MELDKLSLFSVIKRRLAWLGHRQEVLAQNIANADTPKYKPMDLTQQSFRKMLVTTLTEFTERLFDRIITLG